MEPIPNPSPKTRTTETNLQWFSVCTPNSPDGQARIKAWGYDGSNQEVDHADKITDINVPFELLVFQDEEENFVLPKSAALINLVLSGLPDVIKEIEDYKASLQNQDLPE